MTGYCYNQACTKDFLNLEGDVAGASKAGFDLIELRFDCLRAYLEHHTLSDLKSLIEGSKLKLGPLNALYIYPEFLTSKSDKKRDQEIYENLAFIEQLHAGVGFDQCIVVAPLLEDEAKCATYSKEQVKEDCIRILGFLSLKMPSVRWLFEPVGLKRSLVQDGDFAFEIVKEAGAPNLGLVLDAYNLYLKERSDDYSFSNLDVSKIGAVHLMNGKKVPEGENIVDQRYRVLCQDGDAINLNNFLEALRNINYKGMISTEIFNPDYKNKFTQQEIIKRAFDQLSGVLNLYAKMEGYLFF